MAFTRLSPYDFSTATLVSEPAGDFSSQEFEVSVSGVADTIRLRHNAASGLIDVAIYEGMNQGDAILSYDATHRTVTSSGQHDYSTPAISVVAGQTRGISLLANTAGLITSSQIVGVDSTYYSPGFGVTFPSVLPAVGGWVTLAVELWGFPLPSITNINGGASISSTQTGVILDGLNLLDTQGNASVILWENSDFTGESATQLFNSQTDSSINFDVVPGNLSNGTVYAQVVTGYLQSNATAFPVTLTGVASVPTAGATNFDNAAQTILGTGTVVPVGQTVNLDNAAQTFVGTGEVPIEVPTSGIVALENAAQSLAGTGSVVPTGQQVILNNAAQSFYGTGEVVTLVPTSGIVALGNAAQSLTAIGTVVPVSQSVNLDNGAQSFTGTGLAVPSANAVDFENAPQSFYGTGEVVAQVPTSSDVNLENAAQVLSGVGAAIPAGQDIELSNSAQEFFGTGTVLNAYPSSGDVGLQNAAQVFSGVGASIPASGMVALNNAEQSFFGIGAVVPIGQTVELENAAQTFLGTGSISGGLEPLKNIIIDNICGTIEIDNVCPSVELDSKGE